MRVEQHPHISTLLFFLLLFLGKVFVPKQKPIDLRQEEVTTLDPELEEALSSATDTELCDLAGESGKFPPEIVNRPHVHRLAGKHEASFTRSGAGFPRLGLHTVCVAFVRPLTVLRSCSQPSWAFTLWSPAVRRTTAPRPRKASTVRRHAATETSPGWLTEEDVF